MALLERNAGDDGDGAAGEVLSPHWWLGPAQRRKALKVTVAERIQRERADGNLAVWAGSDFGRIRSRQAREHLNVLPVCFWSQRV